MSAPQNNSDPAGSNASETRTFPTIDELVSRSESLLGDIRAFESHLSELRRTNVVNEVRSLRNSVQSDLRTLEKVASGQSSNPEQTGNIVRSSNVPFYETVWGVARERGGVMAFMKRFWWEGKGSKNSAFVDVVARGGLEWHKVSMVTETRLLFELAKLGWELGDQSEGSEEDCSSREEASDTNEKDDESVVSVVQMARSLAKTAQRHRVRYRRPRVFMHLPRLGNHEHSPEVDGILRDIRKTGVELHLTDPPSTGSNDSESLSTLTGYHLADITDPVNLDCTILLALVSDISHFSNPLPSDYQGDDVHSHTRAQIELEREDMLIPNLLYPAIIGRRMFCTVEAARRMQEIVQTIGTDTERRRMDILLSEDATTSSDLVSQWSGLSDHTTPAELHLPVDVQIWEAKDSEMFCEEGVRAKLASELSEINRNVFFYGWRQLATTLTSNRTVAKQLEDGVNEWLDQHPDEEKRILTESSANVESDDMAGRRLGPDMWICHTARSLVGKERGRKEHSRRNDRDRH